MKKSVCTMLVLVAALAVAAFADDKKPAGSQPSQADMQAMMAAMSPGPQHELMKQLTGNHTYTMKMWQDPAAPPMESTGKRSAELLLGGRFLQEKYSGTFMGMPFEGIGWLGYDNAGKQWVGSWIDNMGTGIMNSTGTYDNGMWSMTGESTDPATGKKWSSRSTLKIVDANTFQMEMYSKGADGKEMKMFEMTCKKAM